MSRRIPLALLAAVALVLPARADAPAQAGLSGVWVGTVSHDGAVERIALDLEPDSTGVIGVRLSMPVVHLDHVPMGRYAPVVDGDSIALGPFRFARDGDGGVLSGLLPHGLAPVYDIPMHLERSDTPFRLPARPPIDAPSPVPDWIFDTGSPSWAGPIWNDGVVYLGAQDGRLFAVDGTTGTVRWTYRAGGPIRTRPVISDGTLYVQADDGFLYALAAADGAERWVVKIVMKPIERLPFSDPRSRYDRFGSDVTVDGGWLYVGTHDGHVLALDPKDGRERWSFAAGDAVLAAPAVRDGRVYAGSYDGFVYALAAADGRVIWKRDTRGAVVSTPALHDGCVIVGNRCYDLMALDATTGDVVWKDYIWMSWVESSPVVLDGVAYAGSSDAAAVLAVDASSGARRWTADVHGWSWGQPAVTAARVYAGTSGQAGYPVPHDGALVALDRTTGAVAWRFVRARPDSGAFGFPGSPAVGGGRVYATSLDGRLYAFPE